MIQINSMPDHVHIFIGLNPDPVSPSLLLLEMSNLNQQNGSSEKGSVHFLLLGRMPMVPFHIREVNYPTSFPAS